MGKNGGHTPSSLGGRLIVVVRQIGGWEGGQADDMFLQFLKIHQQAY